MSAGQTTSRPPDRSRSATERARRLEVQHATDTSKEAAARKSRSLSYAIPRCTESGGRSRGASTSSRPGEMEPRCRPDRRPLVLGSTRKRRRRRSPSGCTAGAESSFFSVSNRCARGSNPLGGRLKSVSALRPCHPGYRAARPDRLEPLADYQQHREERTTAMTQCATIAEPPDTNGIIMIRGPDGMRCGRCTVRTTAPHTSPIPEGAADSGKCSGRFANRRMSRPACAGGRREMVPHCRNVRLTRTAELGAFASPGRRRFPRGGLSPLGQLQHVPQMMKKVLTVPLQAPRRPPCSRRSVPQTSIAQEITVVSWGGLVQHGLSDNAYYEVHEGDRPAPFWGRVGRQLAIPEPRWRPANTRLTILRRSVAVGGRGLDEGILRPINWDALGMTPDDSCPAGSTGVRIGHHRLPHPLRLSHDVSGGPPRSGRTSGT